MKTTVEEISPVKKKIMVEIEADEVEKELNQAFAELRKRTKIKGFRPGKAPLKLLERYYGDQIIDDVTSKIIRETFPQALQEVDAQPLNMPALEKENLVRGKSFKYSAVMEVKPEFQLSQYLGLEAEKEAVNVTDEDIENRLEEIRKGHGKLNSITEDRGIQEEDYVILEYEAFADGEPIEGMKSENFLVKVGAGDFHPDFEKALIGLRRDEEKEIHVDFEENFYHRTLAGKSVDFKVKISDIKTMSLPELNDEFVESLGVDFKTVAELREKVKEALIQENENRVQRELKEKLMEQIRQNTEIPLPESLVEAEINDSIEGIKQNLLQSGSSMEKAGLSEEKLREEIKPSAEKKVKDMLILAEIAEKEKISVTDEDLEEGFQELGRATGQDPEILKKYYEARGLLDNMRHKLLQEKTLNYLVEHAKIIEKQNAGRVENQ